MARIAGVDLPREKRVEIGLTYICLLYTSCNGLKSLRTAEQVAATRGKTVKEILG